LAAKNTGIVLKFHIFSEFLWYSVYPSESAKQKPCVYSGKNISISIYGLDVFLCDLLDVCMSLPLKTFLNSTYKSMNSQDHSVLTVAAHSVAGLVVQKSVVRVEVGTAQGCYL
jgi:hypothetical protein